MTLFDLRPGDCGVVDDIQHPDLSLVSRIMALGIIPGETIQVLRQAPLGDPIQVKAGHTLISIRRCDSHFVKVTQPDS